MRFGMLYELQLPKPWDVNSEQRLVDEAIEQCVLGDKLGIDYAWSVEHHFLEEYSHCSASEVFLSAIAARTERIKIGFGIRQVISNYCLHPTNIYAYKMLNPDAPALPDTLTVEPGDCPREQFEQRIREAVDRILALGKSPVG